MLLDGNVDNCYMGKVIIKITIQTERRFIVRNVFSHFVSIDNHS